MSNLKIKKSKILLIILCLLALVFSYSCSCRNDSTGPGNDGNGGGGAGSSDKTPTWSFSPSLDLKNSYNISFKSDGTEGLHATVNFIEADKTEIKKIEIEEVTDPQSVLTKDKMQLEEDGKLTIPKETLKNLAEKLTSTDKPATNEVTIKFKLTSTNDTSDNNIQYIEHTFNFIKAQKFDENNIQGLIRSCYEYQFQFEGDSAEQAHFSIKDGTYRASDNTFTIKEVDNKLSDTDNAISKSEFKKIKNYLQNNKNTKDYFTEVSVGEPKEKGNTTIEFDLTLKFGDIYETDIIMPITVVVTKSKGGWIS